MIYTGAEYNYQNAIIQTITKPDTITDIDL